MKIWNTFWSLYHSSEKEKFLINEANDVKKNKTKEVLFHDWNIYIDENTHLVPGELLRIVTWIIDWFVLEYDKDPQGFTKKLTWYRWEFAEYIERQKNKIPTILDLTARWDISQIVIEASEEEIQHLEETTELIWGIVDVVFSDSSNTDKELLKKDLMILYWWPYVYLKVSWKLNSSIKIVPWDSEKLKKEWMSSFYSAQSLRENIINIAKVSEWKEKIYFKDFSTIEETIKEAISLNSVWLLEDKKEDILQLVENNHEVYCACEDWIQSTIDFLLNSSMRDEFLTTVVSRTSWNSIVVFGRQHSNWLKQWLKKRKHWWKVELIEF